MIYMVYWFLDVIMAIWYDSRLKWLEVKQIKNSAKKSVAEEDEIQHIRLDYKYDRGVITMENPGWSEIP